MKPSFVVVALLWPAFVSNLFAGEQVAPLSEGATNQVITFTQKGPHTTIEHCWITGKENKFAFAAPTGFAIRANPEGTKVVINKPSDHHVITIEIIERGHEGGQNVASLKSRAELEVPNARIVNEFVLSAGGMEAPAFDLVSSRGGSIGTRVVFAVLPRALVQFKLTGMAKNDAIDPQYYAALSSVLMSFQRLDLNARWQPPMTSVETD